jgi:hypothetical protein
VAEWTPELQRRVFCEAYLAARCVFPGMGGRFVDQFHGVVMATAQAQRECPEKLFRRHLATWLAKMPAKARTAPYAFFAQAWGELADKGPALVEEEAPRPRAKPEEQMAELRAQLQLLEADLSHARTFGERGADAPIAAKMEAVRAQMRRCKGEAARG